MSDYFRSGVALASRLERGEVIVYPSCPFPLPADNDRLFLFEQRLDGRRRKNISYDPHTGGTTGFRTQTPEHRARLSRILETFSETACAWLSKVLPEYAVAWKLDRVSYRPEEEATRQLRLTARNDLLHIDAFPNRPTLGWRLLRLFVNINAIEPRVWVTSETFSTLLARYGGEVGAGTPYESSWLRRIGHGVLRSMWIGHHEPSEYDAFMCRFHHFLKRNDRFQERCAKRFWSFPPGAAWLVMTDGVSYAELRGQHALEHSYFISPQTLAHPKESPASLIAQTFARAA